MSSLRNAVSSQRRAHKERSQPAGRAGRFPFLEKKKDYVLRHRDYESKKARIQTLKEKARDRNPDEFYFGMINEKTKKGVVVHERGTAKPLDEEMLKLFKTQDENYLRTVARQERRRIQILQKEQGASSRVSTKQHYKFGVEGIESVHVDADKEEESSTTRRISAHQSRLSKLKALEETSQLHRQLMTKGPRKKIVSKNGEQVIYKWKPQRRR